MYGTNTDDSSSDYTCIKERGDEEKKKWAYHDVHVEPIGAAVKHAPSFRGQVGEVGGKHRGRYFRRFPHICRPVLPR